MLDTQAILNEATAEAVDIDARLAELTTRRETLQRLIQSLLDYDATLIVGGSVASGKVVVQPVADASKAIRAPRRRRNASPARDAILAVLEGAGGEYLTTDEIVDRLTERGTPNSAESVRKVLLRAAVDQEIRRKPLDKRANVYAALTSPTADSPKDTSSAAGTALDVGVTTQDGEGGEVSNAQDSHGDRPDHHPNGWHADSRGGDPAVMVGDH